jgi:hypothetical protein
LRFVRAQHDIQQYGHARRRLEESRRAGLDLVEAAYQAQLRTLERVCDFLAGAGETPLPTAPTEAYPPPQARGLPVYRKLTADLPPDR